MEILNFLDHTPLLGLVKGFLHYNMGEKEKGNKAMKRSFKSTCIYICTTLLFASTVFNDSILKFLV